VVRSIRIFNECLQHVEKSFMYCVYSPPPTRAPPLFRRLRVALYYVHLKVVLSVYPRSNLFVLQLENYMQDEVTWLRRIMQFLDVSLMSVTDIEDIIQKRKAANSNKKGYKKSGPMLNETKILLEEFYKPYNVHLQKLLGDGYLAY
jgi:N-acetylgalactosamine 4-sulfate 6-O-sulfotransferase